MTAPGILLTGATGYVGGRLLAELERRGVPCVASSAGPSPCAAARRLPPRSPPATCSIRIRRPGPRGRFDRYYLIHSMGGEDFAARDREAAENFGERRTRGGGPAGSSTSAGWERARRGLSEHLRSRQETGEILRQSGVPVVELRASIVLGSGSLSFEMVRALVERLPVMICPRWVAVEAQPIAIEDVVAYLVGALDLPAGAERDLRDRRARTG